MAPFDHLERFGKAFVVVVQFGRPFPMIIGRDKVSSSGGSSLAIAGMNSVGGRRPILSFTDTGILGGFGQYPGRTPVESTRPEQTSLDFLRQGGTTERGDFLAS